MEVIAMQGRASEIHHLADALLKLKGVKHGKLFTTLPAKAMTKRESGTHAHTAPHKH